jgi:H+/gluconate symporter-like permease
MGLFGILLGLALLVWLAYKGWSILLLAPGVALIAAAFRGRTATRLLDADFHGQRFAFCRAVLPAVPCSARFSAS